MTIRVKAILCQGIRAQRVSSQGKMPDPKVALAKGDHNHWH